MFLYAQVILNVLEGLYGMVDIENELEHLPEDLDEA